MVSEVQEEKNYNVAIEQSESEKVNAVVLTIGGSQIQEIMREESRCKPSQQLTTKDLFYVKGSRNHKAYGYIPLTCHGLSHTNPSGK